MSSVERNGISNFILSNKKFLELAFDVEDAMLGGMSKTKEDAGHGVRLILIKSVLDTLGDHVKPQLGCGWKVEISPRTKWGSMTIKLDSWPILRDSANGPPVPVEVRLANDIGNWEQVCIGFRVHRFGLSDPGRAALTAALLPAMMPGAIANDWWAAVEWPGNPFRNWWDRGFLVNIGYAAYRARTDANAAPPPREIAELGDHLVGIAKAAAKATPIEWSAQPASS